MKEKEITFTKEDLEKAFNAGRKQYSRLTWSDEFVDDFTYTDFTEWFKKFNNEED